MAQSAAATKQILMSDMFAFNNNVNERRFKVSSQDSSIEAALSGFRHSVSVSANIQSGEKLALNLSLASNAIVKVISSNSGLPILITNQHATGTAGAISGAINLNLLSDDVSPTQGQVYTSAVTQGDILLAGESVIDDGVIAGYQDRLSAVVENTGEMQDIAITIVFEEIGDREPLFGLTSSTLLQPNTEMSLYG